MVARAHLVQTKHFTGRVVEFVVVDLDVGEGGVELDVDIALPGGESEGGHDAVRGVVEPEGLIAMMGGRPWKKNGGRRYGRS